MCFGARRPHLPQVGERTVDELLESERQVGLGRALELVAGRERAFGEVEEQAALVGEAHGDREEPRGRVPRHHADALPPRLRDVQAHVVPDDDGCPMSDDARSAQGWP